MTTPLPPRSQSPLMELMTSPRTCVATIAIASLHPQRRHRNQPIPAVMRAAPSARKRIPTTRPSGASCLYAVGLRSQTRSRAVPRQSNVIAARLAMTAPKNRKIPIAVNPGVLGAILAEAGGVHRSASAEYKPTLQTRDFWFSLALFRYFSSGRLLLCTCKTRFSTPWRDCRMSPR